jgi:cobalt/nickel transport system permease protein
VIVASLEGALAHVVSFDELSRRDTPASRLDARVKVVATLAFVAVTASFGRTEPARLAPLALFPLALGILGDVPARPVLVRLALASPFALGVAAFEPFLHRGAALAVGPLVVSEGALAFVTILAKFALALGAALVLVATTGFDEVTGALRRLGLPGVLATQLALTYRYLFVLGDEASRLVRAHGLRAGGRRPGPRVAGTLLGQLLGRALARAERVHVAMRCRGFTGVIPPRRAARIGAGDLAFCAASAALLVLARAVDLPTWLGRLAGGAG